MSHRFPGRFIILEGIDGSGTTSQTHLLLQAFTQASISVQATAEPSRGPIGTFVRTFLKEEQLPPPPISMALLFAADRHAHLEQEIIPWLKQGVHVICDRYVLSSFAYQQAAGVSRDFIQMANQGIYLPDITFFLQVSPEIALERRMQRAQSHELYDDHELQRKIALLYQKEAETWNQTQSPLFVVDGAKGKEEVFDTIIQHLRKSFNFSLSLPKVH